MIIGPRKKLRKQYPSQQPQIILNISGVTLIKQMKGMYYKNFKILKKRNWRRYQEMERSPIYEKYKKKL